MIKTSFFNERLEFKRVLETVFDGGCISDLYGWDVSWKGEKNGTLSYSTKGQNSYRYISLYDEDLNDYNFYFDVAVIEVGGRGEGWGERLELWIEAPVGEDIFYKKIVHVDYTEHSRYSRCGMWEGSVYLTLTLENGAVLRFSEGDTDYDRTEEEDEYALSLNVTPLNVTEIHAYSTRLFL